MGEEEAQREKEKETEDDSGGQKVTLEEAAHWWEGEEAVERLTKGLDRLFPGATVVERHGLLWRFVLPLGALTPTEGDLNGRLNSISNGGHLSPSEREGGEGEQERDTEEQAEEEGESNQLLSSSPHAASTPGVPAPAPVSSSSSAASSSSPPAATQPPLLSAFAQGHRERGGGAARARGERADGRVSGGSGGIGLVFERLEAAKEEMGIWEYSVSQTSLEQIFNRFAAEAAAEEGRSHGD